MMVVVKNSKKASANLAKTVIGDLSLIKTKLLKMTKCHCFMRSCFF